MRTKYECQVVVIDGDTVEWGNLERQTFINKDIHKGKAEIHQRRLTARNIDCRFYDREISSADDLEKWVDSKCVTILVGAVDNNKCRRYMHEFFMNQHTCYYLDSGNEFSYGEIVTGVRLGGRTMHNPRAIFFPEVLTDTKEEAVESCEEINQHEPQHILTNMTAANILMIVIDSILSPKKGPLVGVYAFDIEKCSVGKMVR